MLRRKGRPTGEKGSHPGVPTGSDPPSPVPLGLPLPSLKIESRGSLSPWSSLAFVSLTRGLGQEAARTGNRAEAGRRSGRGGQDPGPAHTQPYQSSGEQQGVSKNIYSESKLMSYCISTDNGRMWSQPCRGEDQRQQPIGCTRDLELGEGPPTTTRGGSQALHPGARAGTGDNGSPSLLPGPQPPREQEDFLDPPRLQRASPTCLPAPTQHGDLLYCTPV